MRLAASLPCGLRCAAAALVLGLALLPAATAQTVSKRLAPVPGGSASPLAPVSPSVAARAARNEPVDVLLLLDDRLEQLQLRSAVGPLSARPRMDATEYASFLGTQRGLMRSLKQDVMATAADPDISTLTDYENLPVVHLRIRSARALDRLRRQAKIRSIDEIVVTRPSLAQSLPLVGQPAMQAAGRNGAGTTVAVLDTGVDFTRPAFGSCSAPGGACKVAYAQDFAAQDNARDSNGHGTNVAGIVLGVAPGTRIAALDVFESSGGAYSNVIINAINWTISNRATYNIVAINMSLGGGRHYAPLSPTDAWGTAIANAVNAGIAVVVASGNDAYRDSLAAPAAYSNVISVGATYDASMGGIGWSRCSDASSAAWRVTCFSNSASFLTMLAPGSQISAAGLTQSGTSQATPHVAGAVAVLKAAYPTETVAQITNRLKLGATITDPRNGVTKPRLDLAAALAEPPTSYRLTVAKAGTGTGTVSSPAGIDCGRTCTADPDIGASVTLTALHGPRSMFSGWSGACAGASTTCTVSMTAARSVTAIFLPNTSEDFVASDGLSAAWGPAAGSTAAWAPSTLNPYVGTLSMKSGALADGQTSALQFSGRFRDGVVSFARRVSSQSGQDELRFYIDDVLQGSWSGEVAWGMVAYPVSAGEHTLRWAYVKDGSGAAGSDSAWIDSVNLPLAHAGARRVPSDFDGDGRSDVFWRHGGTGAHSLWLMSGSLRQSGSGSPPTLADPNWRVVGADDFDGDGKTDLLWRHASSGRNTIWFMDELERLSTTGETLAIADRNWQVAGTGDFDGDGKADIFWRHATTGRNAIWLMDGLSRRAESAEIAPITDLNWRAAAVADMDGDGKADIVWRHARDGRNAIWTMDGLSRTGNVPVTTVADPRWRVVSAGDFDGDGKADLLWRHVGTGGNALWMMDGAMRTNSVTTLPAIADLGWKVAGTGDYDGDGKADILWRHASRGTNALWRMDGVVRLASYNLMAVADARWGVVAPRAGAQ